MSQYYKKYMKKKEEEKPSYLKLFIGAFLLVIVAFMSLAIHLTLSVDTTIGENDEGDMKESGLGVKHLIDSRLRLIQMEDAGKTTIKENTEDNDIIETYSKDIEIKTKAMQKEELEKSSSYKEIQLDKTNTLQKPAAPSPVVKPAVSNTVSKPISTTTTPAPATKPISNTNVQLKPTVLPAQSPMNPKTYTPSYQVQKNLAPTGMN